MQLLWKTLKKIYKQIRFFIMAHVIVNILNIHDAISANALRRLVLQLGPNVALRSRKLKKIEPIASISFMLLEISSWTKFVTQLYIVSVSDTCTVCRTFGKIAILTKLALSQTILWIVRLTDTTDIQWQFHKS